MIKVDAMDTTNNNVLLVYLSRVIMDGDGIPQTPDIDSIQGCQGMRSACATCIQDGIEIQIIEKSLDPNNVDTDGDGINDGDEIKDASGDWPDVIPASNYNPNESTDPLNPDTDSDGYTDGQEVTAGTNPRDINSHP